MNDDVIALVKLEINTVRRTIAGLEAERKRNMVIIKSVDEKLKTWKTVLESYREYLESVK